MRTSVACGGFTHIKYLYVHVFVLVTQFATIVQSALCIINDPPVYFMMGMMFLL